MASTTLELPSPQLPAAPATHNTVEQPWRPRIDPWIDARTPGLFHCVVGGGGGGELRAGKFECRRRHALLDSIVATEGGIQSFSRKTSNLKMIWTLVTGDRF